MGCGWQEAIGNPRLYAFFNLLTHFGKGTYMLLIMFTKYFHISKQKKKVIEEKYQFHEQ